MILQEQNAFGIINGDTLSKTVTIGVDNITKYGGIPNIYGLRMPHTMLLYDNRYIITTNIGSKYMYNIDYNTVNNLKLDENVFDIPSVNASVGDLEVSIIDGDTDNDGKYEELYAFGSQSITIFEISNDGDNINEIYSSGNEFNNRVPNLNDEQPNSVTIAGCSDDTYLFVGFTNIGGILQYNINDINTPTFDSYTSDENMGIDKILTDETQKLLVVLSSQSNAINVYKYICPSKVKGIPRLVQFIIITVLLIITLLMFVVELKGIHKFTRKANKINPKIRILSIMIILLYFIAVLFMDATIFLSGKLAELALNLGITIYVLAGGLFYFYSWYRLYITFKGTIYQIETYCIPVHILPFVLNIASFVVSIVGIFVGLSDVVLYSTLISLTTVIIPDIILVFGFLKKLFQLTIQTEHGQDHTESNKDTKLTLHWDKSVDMISKGSMSAVKLMTKFSVLTSSSMLSTSIVLVLIILISLGTDNVGFRLSFIIVLCIDALINIVCILLQFSFNAKYYTDFCVKCDKCTLNNIYPYVQLYCNP